MSPLLSAVDLRLDLGAHVVVEGLSFETRGDRVLVFGAAQPVLRAAQGELRARRGQLLLDGHDPAEAARSGAVAIAPLDPLLPPELTPRAYVEWSARLATNDTGRARKQAAEAITALTLDPIAHQPLGRCVATARRATVLAAALATGARAILFEDPTAGLVDEAADALAGTLVKALAGVRWAVFAARLPPTSPLTLAADEALVLGSQGVLAQGSPAELAASARRFALEVRGEGQAFADALVRRGFSASGTPPRLLVELAPEQGTLELFALALEHHAVIVELSPLSGALA